MIFVFWRCVPDYRLRSYMDFFLRFPRHYPDVVFYGPGLDDLPCPYAQAAIKFEPGVPLERIAARYASNARATFIMSSSRLTEVGVTDFAQLPGKKALFITDALEDTGDGRTGELKRHANVDFDFVFHNYLYRIDLLEKNFPKARRIHFPCWSAHCYDWELTRREKTLDFMLSGVPAGGGEYQYRDVFANVMAYKQYNGLSVLGGRVNQRRSNEEFQLDLLRSRWSPHDGGKNGRMVPRYFESCFARSVILSPDLGEEMRSAGFEHEKNCILFKRGMSGPDVGRLMDNCVRHNDWIKLADNAYALAAERHCTDARIKTFLTEVLS